MTSSFVFIIGLIGVYVAFQQWLTAEKRLRLDLFDRRLKVYRACADFHDSVVSKKLVDDIELNKLYSATEEAEWLFNEEVAECINNEIWGNALTLQQLQKEASKDSSRIHEHKKSLIQSDKKIKKLCSPFMKIDQGGLPQNTRQMPTRIHIAWRKLFNLPTK